MLPGLRDLGSDLAAFPILFTAWWRTAFRLGRQLHDHRVSKNDIGDLRCTPYEHMGGFGLFFYWRKQEDCHSQLDTNVLSVHKRTFRQK